MRDGSEMNYLESGNIEDGRMLVVMVWDWNSTTGMQGAGEW